jgi:hypothetical protein
LLTFPQLGNSWIESYEQEGENMETILWGMRNVFRSKSKTAAIVLLLGLCLSLGIMMINVDISANRKLEDIKRDLGTMIDIRLSDDYIKNFFENNKASAFNEQPPFLFEETLIDQIAQLEHIKSTTKMVHGAFYSRKLKSSLSVLTDKNPPGEGIIIGGSDPGSESKDPRQQFFLQGIENGEGHSDIARRGY